MVGYLNHQFEAVKTEVRVQTSAHHQQLTALIDAAADHDAQQLAALRQQADGTNGRLDALERQVADLTEMLVELRSTTDQMLAVIAAGVTQPST